MLPAEHIARSRLITRLAARPVAVVEAAAGYGKSTLAREYARSQECAVAFLPLGEPDRDLSVLTASLRRALRFSRLSDLAATMDVPSPVECIEIFLDALAATSAPLLLVIDDAHLVDGGDSHTAILRLARGVRPPHRMLLTARKLPPGLEPLRFASSVSYLDTAALTFTTAETVALATRRRGTPPSQQDVELLLTVTAGWPTALVLALPPTNADAPRSTNPIDGYGLERLGSSGVIAPLLEGILAGMAPTDRELLGELGHLPLLSIELVDGLARRPGTFDRLVAAGAPLARAASGWWELPGPVVKHLVARFDLSAETAVIAADIYRRDSEIQLGIRLLIAAGAMTQAAAALADLSPAEASQLGLPVLEDLVGALPDEAIAASPRVLLHLARVAATSHRDDVRSAALARARRIVEDSPSPDPIAQREVDAERARDLMWDERTRAEAKELASGVLTHATDGERVATARALDVLGRLASWFSTDGPQPEAERLLIQSARLSRQLGQATWAAQALTALAMGYYYAVCRYDRCLDVLDEALGALPARSTYRAGVLSFRVDLLAELGRGAEAAAGLVEMRELGRVFREEWIVAYAAWSQMMLASYSGDAAGTVTAAAEAEAHADVWLTQPSGVEFLAQAADALSRVAEHTKASQYLDRARARMASNEKEVRVHEAAVLARSGDPGLGRQAVDAALARSDLNSHERWPLLLLRAYAAKRAGDPDTGSLAAEAFEACADLDHIDGPGLREPEIARVLLPLAAGAGSVAAQRLLAGATRFVVSALGSFEVRQGGRHVTLPGGRPNLAVRAVVGAGGRLRVNLLIERLWPDTDPETGRRRLRNLLNRLHAAAGPILVRDGDTIALPVGCEVDAIAFETEARRALTGTTGTSATVRARSALARYRGDLLPDDVDHEWAESYRQRLRGYYIDLLDVLASDAEARGELDEAIRLTQRAIDAEPYDEQRYLRLVDWLRSQGRIGTARGVLARARAALADLTLVPSPRFEQVERALGRPSPGYQPPLI